MAGEVGAQKQPLFAQSRFIIVRSDTLTDAVVTQVRLVAALYLKIDLLIQWQAFRPY